MVAAGSSRYKFGASGSVLLRSGDVRGPFLAELKFKPLTDPAFIAYRDYGTYRLYLPSVRACMGTILSHVADKAG